MEQECVECGGKGVYRIECEDVSAEGMFEEVSCELCGGKGKITI